MKTRTTPALVCAPLIALAMTAPSLLALDNGPAPARALASSPSIAQPLPTPGMGWSTYNFFVARHSDRLLRQMGDAFVKSGLRDAGYTILRIDGGWWGDDGNRRWWYWTEAGQYAGGLPYLPGDPHVDPRNYPGGIRPLADYLHGLRLKLGFYLSPSISIGQADNYPGNKMPKLQPPVTGLDLVEQHAKWVADNGVDHLFYDGYDWNQTQGIAPYTRMYESLRQQAQRVGRPIVLSINSGWSGRQRDWADEWRTGRDINGEWATIMECVSRLADPKPGGQGRWNNPDYLLVGFIGDEEARSQMSLWCVTASPLYIAHDFRVLNDWDRYVLLNTEAIAVDQDPAGTSGSRVKAEGAAQVWARPLADGSTAVVLLNAGEKPLTAGVTWAELKLASGARQVRDLWAHENLGEQADGYQAKELPPHGCAFLHVSPAGRAAPAPAATWAPHPGKRPAFKPLDSAGWTLSATFSRKDDPLKNILDGDAKTGFWSYASPGNFLQIDFGKPATFDRVVMDHKGGGPNPWPYVVYAPESTFALEVSDDGQTFRPVASASLGPNCTIALFESVTARFLRVVTKEMPRASAYDDGPTFGAKDLFVFRTK